MNKLNICSWLVIFLSFIQYSFGYELFRPTDSKELKSFDSSTTEETVYPIKDALNKAVVDWANYELLIHDFPDLPDVLGIHKKQVSEYSFEDYQKINHWLISQFAYIGSKQKALDEVRHDKIEIDKDENLSKKAYRPQSWVRSAVLEATDPQTKRVLGMVDIKGFGHGARSNDESLNRQKQRKEEALRIENEKDRTKAINSLNISDHSDGSLKKVEGYAELMRQKAAQAMCEHNGALETVETYAIISLPHGIYTDSIHKDQAALYLRQAHFGRTNNGVVGMPSKYCQDPRGHKQGTESGSFIDFGGVLFLHPELGDYFAPNYERLDNHENLPDAQYSRDWQIAGDLAKNQNPQEVRNFIQNLDHFLRDKLPTNEKFKKEREIERAQAESLIKNLRAQSSSPQVILNELKKLKINQPSYKRHLKFLLEEKNEIHNGFSFPKLNSMIIDAFLNDYFEFLDENNAQSDENYDLVNEIVRNSHIERKIKEKAIQSLNKRKNFSTYIMLKQIANQPDFFEVKESIDKMISELERDEYNQLKDNLISMIKNKDLSMNKKELAVVSLMDLCEKQNSCDFLFGLINEEKLISNLDQFHKGTNFRIIQYLKDNKQLKGLNLNQDNLNSIIAILKQSHNIKNENLKLAYLDLAESDKDDPEFVQIISSYLDDPSEEVRTKAGEVLMSHFEKFSSDFNHKTYHYVIEKMISLNSICISDDLKQFYLKHNTVDSIQGLMKMINHLNPNICLFGKEVALDKITDLKVAKELPGPINILDQKISELMKQVQFFVPTKGEILERSQKSDSTQLPKDFTLSIKSPSGTIWSGIIKGEGTKGEPLMKKAKDAEDYCKSIGASLPTLEQYRQLSYEMRYYERSHPESDRPKEVLEFFSDLEKFQEVSKDNLLLAFKKAQYNRTNYNSYDFNLKSGGNFTNRPLQFQCVLN